MRRIIKAIIVLAIICIPIMMLAYYCSPISTQNTSLGDEKYRAAYDNCVHWLKYKSGWTNVVWFDFSKVRIEPLKDESKDYVRFIADGYKGYFDDVKAEHWVFFIGDPLHGHNSAILVCNSETNKVIGMFPIL